MLTNRIFFATFLHTLLIFAFKNVSGDDVPIDEINQQDIINYINEVKANTDKTVNPCDDFLQYACGEIKPKENNNIYSEMKYINHAFNLEEPKTKIEKTIQQQIILGKKLEENLEDYSFADDLIKELDFLKSFGPFPIQQTGELSSKTVAELEAQSNSIMLGNFFDISPGDNNTFGIKFKREKFHSNKIKEISNFLKNPNTTESDKEIDKVIEFESNLIQLYNTPVFGEIIEIETIEEFNKILPSKNFNWETYFLTMDKLWPHNKQNIKYKYRISHSGTIKNLLKIIDSTDIHTLINYQVYQYIRYWQHAISRLLPMLNNFAAIRKLFDENLSATTIKKYINFLNEYEINLNKTLDSISKSDSSEIENNLYVLKYLMANHTKMIPHEKIEEFYEDYDFNTPYISEVKFMQKVFNFAFYGYVGENKLHHFFYINFIDEFVKPNIKNKPYLYYYKIINFNFWLKYYLYNLANESKMPIVKKCLQQIAGNQSLYDSGIILGLYASLKSTIHFKSSNPILENEIKFIKNLIEPDQLFFMSMAQFTCERDEHHISKESLVTAFSFSEEFSKAFSCPENSTMNRYKKIQCHLEVCEKFFPYRQDLIPFTVTGCS